MRPHKTKKEREYKIRSLDPLDEHHTYFYHLFLKYNIVDEVVIYSTRRQQDQTANLPTNLEFFGKPMRIEYDKTFAELRAGKDQLLFCRQFFHNIIPFMQHVCLIKHYSYGFPISPKLAWLPTFVPYLCKKRNLPYDTRTILLAEGPYNLRYAPWNLSRVIWPAISNQKQYIRTCEKEYDWIVIGNFSRRKGFLSFCQSLIDCGMESLRGCIISAQPITPELKTEYAYFTEKILPKLNAEVHFEVDCAEKMEFLNRSRIFVSTASTDSGPRTVIEAGQAEIPVLAMAHHGSASFLVRNGKNGELTWSASKFPEILARMLNNYDSYDCKINRDILNEERLFSSVIDRLHKVTA
jgi:hypothetical protein